MSALAKWMAAAVVAVGLVGASTTFASAETRALKLHFIHTGEKAEIVFKRNGRYDQAGLKKVNQFLRDWRRNEPTKMDPRLLDLVWEVYRSVGGRDHINVVSAYRSPATNSMLRSRSKGVAEKSQHMLGKAMDFYIPGVALKNVRDAGLKMEVGGVGYYPRSGSPFVHLDVGNVRHWPRMSRKELVSVFPRGNTIHVPSDGKPLPGYEQALASYQARKKNGTTALALASAKPTRSGGLLSALFGGGADEEEDGAEETAPVRAKARTAKAPAVERVDDLPGVPAAAPVPAPVEAMPAVERPAEPTPQAIIAALPARDVPLPVFAPRPKAEVGAVPAPFGAASAEPMPAVAVLEDAPGIPLPTWRPDYVPQAKVDAVLMALASPTDAATAQAASVPVPERRPDNQQAFYAGIATQSSEADQIAAAIRDNDERLALLSKPQKPAVLVKVQPAEQAAVRTTAKAARPSVSDQKPAPKPQVVAAQPNATRWAFETVASANVDHIATSSSRARGSAEAQQIVRAAPREVYALGFRQDSVTEADRFSGKAVSFLPVAHFATN